jgi:hypothetical protein
MNHVDTLVTKTRQLHARAYFIALRGANSPTITRERASALLDLADAMRVDHESLDRHITMMADYHCKLTRKAATAAMRKDPVMSAFIATQEQAEADARLSEKRAALAAKEEAARKADSTGKTLASMGNATI